MEQGIAPKVLTVNGQTPLCLCKTGVVCAHCVQANLIVWDRKEHPGEKVKNRVLKAIKKTGVRKSSRLLGVSPGTVNHWLRTGNIPLKYVDLSHSTLGVATYPFIPKFPYTSVLKSLRNGSEKSTSVAS